MPTEMPDDPVPDRAPATLPPTRFVGCLLGGAVGDALGADIEFRSLSEIRSRYGSDGPSEIGVAYGVPGAITDDTQMTLFTAEGALRGLARMRARGIGHLPSVVHHAYLRWLHTQGETSSHTLLRPAEFDGWLISERRLFAIRAPGATCLWALKGPTMGTMETPLNDSKGCGGVMRAAPVGLLVPPEAAFRIGAETAAITHGHPSGYLAAGALAVAVADLVRGTGLDAALDTAEAELAGHANGRECLDALCAARRLAAEGDPTPERPETLGGGWVAEEALAIAVYCALVGVAGGGTPVEKFERAVRLAVTHSGDSDSTGAITGNLLGATLGVEAIPPRWLDRVELRDVVTMLAEDLCRAAQGGRIDVGRYPGW